MSTRHLSFLESGRALPSREMVVRLAEQLDVPLRERNRLLVAAGLAPVYAERPLDHQALRAATRAVDQVLQAHEPYPGLAIDRHWTMVRANSVVARLLGGVAADLVAPPVNVVRLSLHPDGLLPRIVNADEWRGHILSRLGRQVRDTGDPVLASLLEEVRAYGHPGRAPRDGHADGDVVVPLRLRTPLGVLSLISTTLLFGSPTEVTLSEVAVELFFPADHATGEALRRLQAPAPVVQD